jgi:hypothetical protein
MRSVCIAILSLFAIAMVSAQGELPKAHRQAVQLRVRHADPWAVKALMEGQQIMSPEISTILNLMGMPPQMSQGANGLFNDGKFIVNPADNSLWFFPN